MEFKKIKSIKKIGQEEVFDMETEDHNYICNNFIVHNSSFSLQDTFEEFEEAKKFQEKYPLACEMAVKLEGHIRHKSSHAAAMIVAEKDINQYVPINKIGGVICAEFEKQLCEDMKLIKFDVLGLKTLTILKDACESAKVELPKRFDDEKVYDNIFKKANTEGVFQLGTVGMQKFSKELNISSFQDLYDATTLFRPSCLHSGQAQNYVNIKSGKEKVSYLHPVLENITKETRGQILYQEQIMKIMNEIGGMSWATAEMARKVITKSKGKDAFNKMRDEFVRNACRIHKIEKLEAEKLYDVVSTFGSYGFNKAHAVEYSTISYWCAWLKYYYPQAFYKAILKYESDDKEIKKYIQDAEKNGTKFEFPDINKSSFSYEVCENKIYAGLNSIIGIGEKTYEKIIKSRPFLSFEDFKKRCKISEKLMDGLIIADAFREFKINKKEKIEGVISEDYTPIETAKMIYEKTTLIPKINISKSFDFGNLSFTDIKDLENAKGKHIFLRGIVTDVLKKDKLLRQDDRHKHKFERRLLLLNLNDDTGNVACQVGPATYEKYRDIIEKIKKHPVIIYGKNNSTGTKIDVDMIEVISGENETDELRKIFYEDNFSEINESYIVSAKPMVSKKGNSFYSIVLANGTTGLCFKFKDKLFPGFKVSYECSQEPFINLSII